MSRIKEVVKMIGYGLVTRYFGKRRSPKRSEYDIS